MTRSLPAGQKYEEPREYEIWVHDSQIGKDHNSERLGNVAILDLRGVEKDEHRVELRQGLKIFYPAEDRTVIKHSTDKPWAELTDQIGEIVKAESIINTTETFASFEATEEGRRNLRAYLEGGLAA